MADERHHDLQLDRVSRLLAGGDAKSIVFFDEVGLDYISCSPFRVPIARLAAAQAAIRRETGESGADD